MRIVRSLVTPSMIVALLALLVATPGAGYAISVPKNSVGSKQSKNGTVKSKDIRDGTVTIDDLNQTSVSQLVDLGLVVETVDDVKYVAGTVSEQIVCPEGFEPISVGYVGADNTVFVVKSERHRDRHDKSSQLSVDKCIHLLPGVISEVSEYPLGSARRGSSSNGREMVDYGWGLRSCSPSEPTKWRLHHPHDQFRLRWGSMGLGEQLSECSSGPCPAWCPTTRSHSVHELGDRLLTVENSAIHNRPFLADSYLNPRFLNTV